MKRILLALLMLAATFTIKAQATWADDIACIVYTHCTTCHHDGGIAPFSLIDYSTASSFSSSIGQMVSTGQMPPWPPDPDYVPLAHERLLSDEEKDLIEDWVSNGAPSGDLATAPTAPTYSSGSQLPSIDLTIQTPEYTNPSSSDNYRCFVIPTGLATDMYITAWEVIPGNNNMVHHVLFFADGSGTPTSLDAADPDPGYTCFGGTGSGASSLIGGWVPGSEPYFYPDGLGSFLEAGDNIVVQVHYAPYNSGEKDSTKINLMLSPGPMRAMGMDPVVNHGPSLVDGPLYIPANEIKTFHTEYTLPAPVSVFSAAPHMHLIGKSIKSYAVTPDNDTIPLIDVPKWDFHWQGFYQYRQPKKLPTGTVVYGQATYDNTVFNEHNPNIPPVDVHLGEATSDEMLLVYFAYTFYYSGDENMVIDTASHFPHYMGCETQTVLGLEDLAASKLKFKVFPNPTSGKLNVLSPVQGYYNLELTDISGKTVGNYQLQGNDAIDVSRLSPGIYFSSFYGEQGQLLSVERFFVQ